MEKTLRDEFAMAALTGFAASPMPFAIAERMHDVAGWSFALADAMLAARGEGEAEELSELRRVVEQVAHWKTEVQPGHSDYISRKGIVSCARAVLAKYPEAKP